MTEIKTTYTPAKYLRGVKKIKSLIRNHDEFAILDACLNYLYAPAKDEIEHLQRHPWLVILVIKWAFIGKSKIYYAREPLDNKRFMRILQATHKLGSLIKMPTSYTHLILFMRNMAYQQFIYQHSFSMLQLGRQLILFEKLPENHSLKTWFKKKHGLSCNDFIELSFALLTHFINRNNHSVELNWFRPLFKMYGEQTVYNFLSAISVDSSELHSQLIQRNKSKGGYAEYYEQTPFVEFPLIKHGGKYICIHQNILYRCIENFIYDSMKADDSSKFMNYFGDIFENYILIGLNYADITYMHEADIKKHIPTSVKCVDYLIYGDDSNIFVDAKAVEMPYLGKITDDPDVILGKVKNTAIKAIEQAFQLNELLLKSNNDKLPRFKEKSYLLVVTYKELYLGNGEVIYEALAQKQIDVITNSVDPAACIDLSRIYFITIEDFDLAMSLVKNHGIQIEDVFEKAIHNDRNAATRKFDFSQHISTLCENVVIPDFLEKETSDMLEKFKVIV